MVISARYEQLKRLRECREDVRTVKVQLARSVFARIKEELEINPDITSFTTPLLKDTERVRYNLRNHPEQIAARVVLGRTVELSLDESVIPPLVTINLGQESKS